MAKPQASRVTPRHVRQKRPAETKTVQKPKTHRSYSLNTYFMGHCYAIRNAWQQLNAARLASLFTMLVIAIALVLPAGLFVMLKNSQRLTQNWAEGTQITLYLKMSSTDAAAQRFVDDIQALSQVRQVHYISPQQGLGAFEERLGLGNVLEQLPTNPLPAVIEVFPGRDLSTQAVQSLQQQLQQNPQVEIAKLDMQWIQRLHAIMAFTEDVVLFLSIFLSLAVIFIVGNTMRLSLQSRQVDVEVQKMLGATNRYIRRPFLYAGMFYGFGASCIAWLIVRIGIAYLQTPLAKVASLYQDNFQLHPMSGQSVLMLFLSGIILGYLGAYLSVKRHLHEFEP